jgi:DNA repair protein RecO (recombination protein O)
MVPEKAQGIVVRTYPYSETSCIATIFTREFGKLRALAKGAWRPKNAFDSALDLLSICQVLVLRRSSGGLDLLTEASLERRFRVGRSLAGFHGGMYLAELLDALTAEADPQPEMFDAVETALITLSADSDAWSSASAPVAVLAAELALLQAGGHGPAVGRCGACGVRLEPTGRTAFGMLDGGALCTNCRRGKRGLVSVSVAGTAALRAAAARAVGRKDRDITIEGRVLGELRAVMNTYVSHTLGRRLNSARHLSNGTSQHL